MSEIGNKTDAGKLRYDLVPVHAEKELARVLTHGADVYGADNWRHVENARSRYTAALLRHIAKWRAGEDIDGTSGCHHLAHAATNAMFLFELCGPGHRRVLTEDETSELLRTAGRDCDHG